MAVAILVAELVGFSRTREERIATGSELSGLTLLHASLFSSWIILFLTQAVLVAIGRSRVHRRLGVGAAVLASIMVVTAPPLAIDMARRAQPSVGAIAFLLIILFDVVGFAVFAAAGIYYRRRAETHRRLMLLATTSLLPPGISRWPIAVANPGPVVLIALVAFLAAAPLHDWRARRRVHPVSLWGGAALLASVPIRLAIAHSEIWHRIGSWLIR